MHVKEPPRDDMGNLKRIENSRDRLDEGRLGALMGRRQKYQDPVEANMETESDEGDKGLEPTENDVFSKIAIMTRG